MKIISIAAAAKNGSIGLKGQLPWEIPEDMKFFRDSTRGHMVLMGRKTLESLGKPLPNRINAVLTRDPNYKVPEGVLLFSDVKTAIDYFRNTQDSAVKTQRDAGKDLFVIGGAQIYEQAMDLVDEVWLTQIDQDAPGDAFFPYFKNGAFLRTDFFESKSLPQTDLKSPYQYRFVFYARS